jgi:hypothetical protein
MVILPVDEKRNLRFPNWAREIQVRPIHPREFGAFDNFYPLEKFVSNKILAKISLIRALAFPGSSTCSIDINRYNSFFLRSLSPFALFPNGN